MSFLGTLINGKRFDHSSHEIAIDGIPVQNIRSITFSESLEPGIQRGTSALKLGRSRGMYDAEGSIEMYVEDFDALCVVLAAKGLGGYMEAEFDVTIVIYEVGANTPTNIRLRGCRITNAEQSSEEGGDVTMTTASLNIMTILRNGIQAVSPAGQ
ncbi:MAG: hypothetical protein ACWGPR_08545 [Candidatus Deferrimicrobiaceae bacterium]